jgi:phosphomevalonate kinase
VSVSRTSAPGKLFLSGEYAVLEGAAAVVTTVDARATAIVGDVPTRVSPVLQAVADMVSGEIFADRPPDVDVNSDAFFASGMKLGLGSSAAACSAACGVLFEHAGLPIFGNRDRILDLASRAHFQAQGGRGSGADVVASVLGGTILFSREGARRILREPEICAKVVWTGSASSTVELLDRVQDFERSDRLGFRRRMDDLLDLAKELEDAYLLREASQIVDLTGEYGLAMKRLGQEAGAPVVTQEHERVMTIAAALGGAAKPSGAGGGDCAVAVFAQPQEADLFEDRCAKDGLQILNLPLHVEGLRVEPEPVRTL